MKCPHPSAVQQEVASNCMHNCQLKFIQNKHLMTTYIKAEVAHFRMCMRIPLSSIMRHNALYVLLLQASPQNSGCARIRVVNATENVAWARGWMHFCNL